MILIPPYLTDISNIRRFKQQQEFILDHYYAHYIYFQRERSKRFERIKESILKNTLSYEFKNWHRVIDLVFVESALSSLGSLLNDPGGRFNIGSIDDIKFSKFPALYIAEDYEIAYREKNQIVPTEKLDSGLSSDELSLTNQGSTVDLLVEGHIESIIDLTDENVLHDFYEVIKDIKLTKALELEAKRLNVPIMYHVRSYDELRRSILHEEWRHAPALADIPANSA